MKAGINPNKGGGAQRAATPKKKNSAKIQNSEHMGKDMSAVYSYFMFNTCTTRDAEEVTGVHRESITWYVSMLEAEGLLVAVYQAPDRNTKRISKYYSANPEVWAQYAAKPQPVELSLFNDKDFES